MQKSSLITFILCHYLKFDKTQPFISITAILAFLGVGVGVMVLLVAMSIMNGMIKEFENRLFIMNYPITIFSTSSNGLESKLLNFLENKFPELKISPYMQTQAVIRMGAEIYPVVVYGVDLEKEKEVNQVLLKSHATQSHNPFDMVIGETLYYALNLQKDEKITLIFTELAPTGLTLSPKMKKFGISGLFSSGLRNYDNSIVYTSFDAIKAIRGLQHTAYEGFHIFSATPMKDIESIRQALQEYGMIENQEVYAEAQGWWEQNGNFFSAMELEKKALFFVLMLIILMASLNIISSLLMVVMNRRKEIALLISLGASKTHIRKIFFRLGVVIGGSGIVCGVVGAFLVMWILKTFDIISIPVDVYGTSHLPIELLINDLIWTIIGACIIVCLSSYYPAKKASQIDVLQVLRNE